jgi:hypothetical protein
MFLLKEYVKFIADSLDSLLVVLGLRNLLNFIKETMYLGHNVWGKESAARRVVLEAAFKVRGERLVQNISN